MNTPVISIIIPIYNTEPYLRKCIDSVLAQSFTDWECVLVDDGSTDHSGSICDAYAAKDSRIRVIHQVNSGRTQARKAGFETCSGKWIMFVDDDDKLMPQAIQVLLEQSADVDVVQGQIIMYCEQESKERLLAPFHSPIGISSGQEYVKQLLMNQRLCAVWRMLIRRDIIRTDMFDTPRAVYYGEDMLFNIRLGLRIQSCHTIEDVVYYYNYYPQNTCYQVKVTKAYCEIFDQQLMAIFSNPIHYQTFAEPLFHYRVSRLNEYIMQVEEVTSLSFLPQLQQDKKKYPSQLVERVLLFCVNIHNTQLRKFILVSYLTLRKGLHWVRRCILRMQ